MYTHLLLGTCLAWPPIIFFAKNFRIISLHFVSMQNFAKKKCELCILNKIFPIFPTKKKSHFPQKKFKNVYAVLPGLAA